MNRLSVFVTTYNNARTLDGCLASVRWADEIVVVDSHSTDDTVSIAERYGARIIAHDFMGYGRQKQYALEQTSHPWVLLLDADEVLSEPLQQEIRTLLAGEPLARGYMMRRQEQLFWRMYHRGVRMNYFLRLFRRDSGHIDDMPIHAAPRVSGAVAKLRHVFFHFGETDIHTKVEKINAYSSGLVAHKRRKRRMSALIMLVYPPFFFVRSYLFKRNFLNGWAGFINSAVAAFYVFLKYAKLYEALQLERNGTDLLPDGAPPLPARFNEAPQRVLGEESPVASDVRARQTG